MTTESTVVQVGVDISKAKLAISLPSDEDLVVNNTLAAIKKWLSGFSKPIELAMEATGIYHLTLAQEAFRRGHTVYLINGYRLNRYRDSVGIRAKTDQNDARLLDLRGCATRDSNIARAYSRNPSEDKRGLIGPASPPASLALLVPLHVLLLLLILQRYSL